MQITRGTVVTSIILITLVFLCFATLQSKSVYYLTPDEALLQKETLKEKQVRIGGMVLANSVKWEAKSVQLDFVLTDMQKSHILVHYKGAPPDMFKENSGVVVQGFFAKNLQSFHAKTLMVKHSEEYKVPGSASKSHSLLVKSLLKEG